MKLGIGVYTELSSRHRFRENRFSKDNTLFNSVNEFLPNFPHFCSDLDVSRYRMCAPSLAELLGVSCKLTY